MMKTEFELGDNKYSINLPDNTKILTMKGAEVVPDPRNEIRRSLDNPIGSAGFNEIINKKLKVNPESNAVIVISDNTRPVPYKGEQGILLPLVERLIDAGVQADKITVLCANGTHTPLSDEVLRSMIDPEVYNRGVKVINHDCLDDDNLKFVGYTSRGTEIKVNRIYVDADIKILTGLVESHFMAGVSGGRKSICPGLIGEGSTFIFHSVNILDNEKSEDLNLKDNPCHEEALEVAKSVGADFIFNVTLNQYFNVTGYFAGDMEEAHLAAFEKVKDSVGINESEKYDIVVTHAGFVGKNHYQAAKAGVASIPLLHENSYLIMGADCIDVDPVGKDTYRKVLPYLKNSDADDFIRMLRSAEWTFIPDQWQVQMWAKVFRVMPQDNFIYYAPQICRKDYEILSGQDGNRYLPDDRRYEAGTKDDIVPFIESSLNAIIEKLKVEGNKDIKIAWLADGPYGIII